MGLLKFSSKGREIANELFMSFDEVTRNKMDMTALLSELIKVTTVKVVFVYGKWCEVDNKFDKNLYAEKLKNKKLLHDWRS